LFAVFGFNPKNLKFGLLRLKLKIWVFITHFDSPAWYRGWSVVIG